MTIDLLITKRTDERLLERMKIHYSQPKGFVGRNICYAVMFDDVYYGHIVAGSATLHLPNRLEFLGLDNTKLTNIVNNIFFNIEPVNGKYPARNFTTKVVEMFCEKSSQDWQAKYGDAVLGFETLVELPRTGELYKRAGFVVGGITKGYTCKRVSGVSTDSYTGRRVWNKADDELRPKLVLYRRNF